MSDIHRERVVMNTKHIERMVSFYLTELYGNSVAERYRDAFCSTLETYSRALDKVPRMDIPALEQHSSVLITYADSVLPDDPKPTLPILQAFLDEYIGAAISTVHILPFYPSSSDDGFSVIDPVVVDPSFGDWTDIHALQKTHRLMFDFVMNHLSQKNAWIQASLQGKTPYQNFAIEMQGNEDTSTVFRPRTSPLLTKIANKLVWTTFSSDQIDVNYQNPQALLAMTEVFLQYLLHGASIIRLDAVAFLWKELGTRCIHHPKTHTIVQFFSELITQMSPSSLLLTETNVPHAENISYFGNGYNEATMVYNFSLPPLVLHTFLSQDATALSSWAKTLVLPSPDVAFFNFLASHDGIGLMPVKNLLTKEEIELMAEHTLKQGGFISKKSEGDGTTSPYELNINYLSALSNIVEGESEGIAIRRFIAAYAIMIFFKGIPGIYIHSLIGSKNWIEAPALSSHPRSINREKISFSTLKALLSNPNGRQARILKNMLVLLEIRRDERALSALAEQTILDVDNNRCFVFLRTAALQNNAIQEQLAIAVNISADAQEIPYPWVDESPNCELLDLVTQTPIDYASTIQLAAYQVMVLKRMAGS